MKGRWIVPAVAVLLAGQAAAFAADAPRMTRAGHVTIDDQSPSRTYQAPYLTVDPENPRQVARCQRLGGHGRHPGGTAGHRGALAGGRVRR
mgnify:CR=1 FL=1